MSSFSSIENKGSSMTPSISCSNSSGQLRNASVVSSDSNNISPTLASRSSSTAPNTIASEYSLSHVFSMTRDLFFCSVPMKTTEPAFKDDHDTPSGENSGIEVGEEESLRHGYQLARV